MKMLTRIKRSVETESLTKLSGYIWFNIKKNKATSDKIIPGERGFINWAINQKPRIKGKTAGAR